MLFFNPAARFHPMPQMQLGSLTPLIQYDSDKVAQCHERHGHVLRVRGKEIYCERCPAVWRDEGF